MSFWPDGVIKAVAEAVVAYRLSLAVSMPSQSDQLTGRVFLLAVSAHLAGQMAAGYAGFGTGSGDRKRLLAFWLAPGVVVSLLAILIRERLGFALVVVCAFAWLLCSGRGIASVTQPKDSQTMKRDLVLGALIMGSVSLAVREVQGRIVLETIVFSLLYSALLVLKRRREVSHSAEERAPWFAGGAVFVAVALVAVFLLYAMGPGGFGAAVSVLGTLREWLATVLGYALMPVAYVVQWLIIGFQRLIAGRTTEGLEIKFPKGDDLLNEYPKERLPVQMPEWVKWSFFLLALILMAYVVWRLVSRFFGLAGDGETRETRMSLARGGALKEWLDDTVGGLAALASGVAAKLRSLLGREPETLEGLYAATLLVLAARGIPRSPELTPYEYRDMARKEIPAEEAAEALDQITTVFTGCFYAERLPLEEELASAQTAYRRILRTQFRASGKHS